MDRTRLIAELDVVRPRWWKDYADSQALREYLDQIENLNPRSFDSSGSLQILRARYVTVLKERTLRTMLDRFWLLGHSALMAKYREETKE